MCTVSCHKLFKLRSEGCQLNQLALQRSEVVDTPQKSFGIGAVSVVSDVVFHELLGRKCLVGVVASDALLHLAT